MRPLLPIALTLVLASTVACDRTAEGLKQDADRNGAVMEKKGKELQKDAAQGAEKAAEAVSTAADAASLQAAGAATTLSVKTALMADKRVDASRIDVDSDAAAMIVHIRGKVTTQPEIELSTQIAQEKAPTWKVSNELIVAPKE
jgi:hypothetical protein